MERPQCRLFLEPVQASVEDGCADYLEVIRDPPPPPPSLPPVLTGHVSSLPPVLTGRVSSFSR